MTTNNFKKAMALSVVPAVSLGILAMPANAQEDTDAVSETAENTINLKVSGLDRDREANVQLVDGEDKVIAEKTVKRNGARVSFDYNSEDVVDGVLTVAVDGETYTTIGAKCTAQSDKEEDSEEPTTSEDSTSEETPAPAPAPSPGSVQPGSPVPGPAQPGSPANTAPEADVADTAPAENETDAPAGDTTGGESEEGGFLDKLGGAGGLLNKGVDMLGGPEGISNMINDGIGNFLGGEGGSIDAGKALDLVSQGAGMLPLNADENLNEDYVKAIEIAANDKDSKISDEEAKDLNLEGTEKESAEAFADFTIVYLSGLQAYAGENPTEKQSEEYKAVFKEELIKEIESELTEAQIQDAETDPYLIKELANGAVDLASKFGGMIPGIGPQVQTGANMIKESGILSGDGDGPLSGLFGGDDESEEAADTEGAEGDLAGGADSAPAEDTATDTGADTANTPSTGGAGTAPAENTGASTDAATDTTADADPAGGSDTVVTSTATPTEVETTGNNIELELEVGDYTIDIFNADEAQLINCSVELLADEFDDEDVFSEIPTPVAKPQANANANKGPLQPAPRAVAPASAAGAYGPKVDTGGQVETSFVTTLIDFFTK